MVVMVWVKLKSVDAMIICRSVMKVEKEAEEEKGLLILQSSGLSYS
jgi:hypothetical protein